MANCVLILSPSVFARAQISSAFCWTSEASLAYRSPKATRSRFCRASRRVTSLVRSAGFGAR
eukprot:3543242-Lingulodinium_polyedra.AAC.1